MLVVEAEAGLVAGATAVEAVEAMEVDWAAMVACDTKEREGYECAGLGSC
jgi:hypothetical protein